MPKAKYTDILDAFYRAPSGTDIPLNEVTMSGTVTVSIDLDSGWALQLRERVVDDDQTNFADYADMLESLFCRARAALLDKSAVDIRVLPDSL